MVGGSDYTKVSASARWGGFYWQLTQWWKGREAIVFQKPPLTDLNFQQWISGSLYAHLYSACLFMFTSGPHWKWVLVWARWLLVAHRRRAKKKKKKKIDKYKKSVLHSHQLTHKIAFEHSGEICCLSDQYQQNTAPVGYVVATKPVAGKRGMRSADSVGIKDEKPLMAVCSGSGPSCVLVSLLYVRWLSFYLRLMQKKC